MLNLGWNSIQSINTQDFSCLHNLDELYMHNNNISLIKANAFQTLNHLKILHLENNPLLTPSIEWLSGLDNSLVELAYNFNQDLQYQFSFEKIVKILVLKSHLKNLKQLDLSGSNFETVYLNLAHLLLTSNKLEVIKCASCSIKYLKFKYDMPPTAENRLQPTLDDQHLESVFSDMFKLHACKKKILNKVIRIDLESNALSSCQASGYKIRDDIDMDFYVHKNYTYNCENMRIHFVKLLMDQVDVKNFDCFHSRKQQKVSWQKYNKRKFITYSNNQICNYKSSILNCSDFYDIKEGNLEIKSNGASGSFLNNKFRNFFSVTYFLVHFLLA